MFDIGFPELLMISVVALLVIGPEKLPETIRSISLWIGRLQRSFANIRQEIENEIGADEIRAQLHNEGIMKDLENAQKTIRDVQTDVNTKLRSAEEEARAVSGSMLEEQNIAEEQSTAAADAEIDNTKDQSVAEPSKPSQLSS
jgi:sec-independent protein translocase protein TatB